LILNWLVY